MTKPERPDDESQNRLLCLFGLVSYKTKVSQSHGHALIERVNTPRRRSASKKSIFARFFHARVLFFPVSTPSLLPGVSIPYRGALEFANPYLASRTVSQQTSLTDFTPVDFRAIPGASSVPFSSPFLRFFAALIARLSNCHFLRQIVLSRVGVTDTSIKLTEEKKKRDGAVGGTGGRRGTRRREA